MSLSQRHALVSLSLSLCLSLLPVVIFSLLPIPALPKVFTPQAMVRIQAAGALSV